MISHNFICRVNIVKFHKFLQEELNNLNNKIVCMSNSVLRQLLTPLGIFPGKATKASELRALIDSLKINPTMQELTRIGPDHDGGYLVPDDLSGINCAFPWCC